jgi:plastocyanin
VPGGELSKLVRAEMNRRAFISAAGVAVAGASLAGLVGACRTRGVTPPSPVTGAVRGTVVDMAGNAQTIGRVYLLQNTGLNVGVHADVDGTGRFDFGEVDVGEYLLRYWGANLAQVPEPLHNPVHIVVAAGTPTVVQFQVVVGAEGDNADREIYAGDFFFQEQPTGQPNAAVVVKLGTVVCWYNVGTVLHTVSGGPWGDSGPIAHDGNFMWTASQVGTFQYSCAYHKTQMVATLQVIA